ncbi:MAG: PSD1 domain-containing protein [Planctomycetaceae bacterium]|nr:PSD1 domain-containing protein [Planctomycetaceae bacterium]
MQAEPLGEVSIEFNRDIRPLLASHCLACHGRDAADRQSGARFDVRDAALAPADSGQRPIVPGDPDASELVRRIESRDPAVVMPPPDSGKSLSEEQQQMLRQWVREGAVFEEHWAFIPPVRISPPENQHAAWVRNPIDNFILAKLERAGLSPSPEADRATLFRRLSLDLTGLPPTPGEFDAFERDMSAVVASSADGATSIMEDGVYTDWVNRLLASPHFGERMAVDWLDAARFADTNGYQVDRDREAYAWRDWVIAAFNANMPFDQFTIEQLAGDLLPEATLQQRVATGFHRNHMLNEEGGIIPEEFLAEYCADRVETTATVWMGQTFLCARCHDHKYDPFTQRDFYSLYAFFHNVPEVGVGNYGATIRRNAPPMLQLPAPELEAKVASLERERAELQTLVAQFETAIADGLSDWEGRVRRDLVQWESIRPTLAQLNEQPLLLDAERASVLIPAFDAGETRLVVEAPWTAPRVTALRLEWTPATATEGTESITTSPEASFQLDELKAFALIEGSAAAQPLSLHAAETQHSLSTDETAKAVDGAPKSSVQISRPEGGSAILIIELDALPDVIQSPSLRLELSLKASERSIPWELQIQCSDAANDLLLPKDIHEILAIDTANRREEQIARVAGFRKSKHPELRRLTAQVAALAKQIEATGLEIPTALVMEEMSTPRPTYIFMRGSYDKPGEAVVADTPSALPAMPPQLPRNRLGLAQWLVDPSHPLTARVAVNRLWQSVFGVGLVRTAEDFGTQGEPPSHPELLDWLAAEFVESGWDVKGMLRLMVTSATYRQSSRWTPQLRMLDPENRLLARGPRFRLQAEFLRDQALAASGLLVPQIGGPSVRPYHPPGLYEQVVSGSSANIYVVGTGSDLYRRSLYTYWKRSVPNPAMLVFDAPFREMCAMRRSRTNTPLQALNLMNDPTYVEAARLLAWRMLRDGGQSPAEQMEYGFRLVLVRPPRASEREILSQAYDRNLAEFQGDPEGAAGLLGVGESPIAEADDLAVLAALTTVASTILNLDETVTKE